MDHWASAMDQEIDYYLKSEKRDHFKKLKTKKAIKQSQHSTMFIIGILWILTIVAHFRICWTMHSVKLIITSKGEIKTLIGNICFSKLYKHISERKLVRFWFLINQD